MGDKTSTDRDVIDQVADSFVSRFRAGERPSVDEYVARYPDLADELRAVLPTLVLLEQNAGVDETAGFAGRSPHTTMPTVIGDYTILRELGRGGMGVVYEAVQQSLGRHVALKVLSHPSELNPVQLERFRLEARAAARLHHTNIVPVFGVGEERGVHYYAMQFIHGQSLDSVIDALRQLRLGNPGEPAAEPIDKLTSAIANELTTRQFQSVTPDNFPAQEPVSTTPAFSGASGLAQIDLKSDHAGREFYRSVARVGLQAAEALSYAHGEGILHRDIKPSNLLLDTKGDVWVTDFGLARDESVDGLTHTGDIVGTLRYMAPERFAGQSDRSSDVYSLGATLYELLTLRPFLDTGGSSPLIDKILHERPLAPSKFNPLIPRDLETIVVKAISKEPNARYRSAAAMAEDLRRFFADRPILARRSTTTEQFARWCRRNPIVAGLTGAVAVLLLAATFILAMSNARIRREANAKDAALLQVTAEAAKSSAISAMFLEALESANPEAAKGADYTVRELLDHIATHLADQLDDQPESKAAIHATIGNAYQRLDLLVEAESHLRSAVEIRRQHFGSMHPAVAESLHDYAWYFYNRYYHQGGDGYANAEKLLREALAIHDELRLEDHHTMAILSLLQLVISKDKTRHLEAEKVAERAIALAERHPGHDAELANVLHRLGGLWESVGESEKGEQLIRRSLPLHRRHHGNDHPETAWALHVLGHALVSQNKLDDAEAAYRESLDIFRKHYNESYVSIRVELDRLEGILTSKGDLVGVQELRDVSISRSREQLRRNPNDFRTKLTLCSDLRAVGKTAEAVSLCSVLLESNPGLAEAWVERAECYRLLGESEKMIEDLTEADKLRPKSD